MINELFETVEQFLPFPGDLDGIVSDLMLLPAVGYSSPKGQQVDFVLGSWDEAERKAMDERLERSTALIRSFVLAGPSRTMNAFNGT